MKTAAPVLLFVLTLAGCRGEDPDQAPPIGQMLVSPAAAAGSEGEPAQAPAMATLDLRERTRRYRAATQAAREQLDSAWNRCGTLAGDTFARCRDQAVIEYDQAMRQSRRTWGDDVDDRGARHPGTLGDRDALAVTQVTGIRG